MCDVVVHDTRVISSSYFSTTPTVQTVTRGTAFAFQDFAETAENLTISTGRDVPIYVDLGDLAQSPWTKPVEIFKRIGQLLNEYVESAVLARHASWTDFGTASIGAGGTAADPITVSASNVDDVIRGVKREVREANGQSLMNQNGLGFVWRAADFEYLEAFVQANGTMTADKFLVEGTLEGLKYLGATHYWSNEHTANHVFAAVRKTERLGILRGLYGKAFTIDFPAGSSNNVLSGKGFYSRIEIGHLTPTSTVGTEFDINVA